MVPQTDSIEMGSVPGSIVDCNAPGIFMIERKHNADTNLI